jgi:L-lactate dehydrogenase complex protein LldF
MSKIEAAVDFRASSACALTDPTLRGALRHATGVFSQKRADATASVPIEEWRERASAIRMSVLDDLEDHVNRFAANATKAGAVVHRARDAATAREIIGWVLKDRGARKVVKSKSMISEEIHLNDHLIAEGLDVIETDLGEYIIQVASEGPSHIIVPAIHKTRKQVGELFHDKLGLPYSEEPSELTGMARKILRGHFLSADAGISGANFAIADSGSLVMFTNEGNGRMVTTLPPLHVAVLSIEKMLPSLTDLPALIRLLPRSATGQVVTSYMSVTTGTRQPGHLTGARELHIVLLDNGRSDVLRGEFREMLKCIRCGACLNACPVYRLVGGHAYGSTYPGPMGIVLTTLLEGMESAHPLLDATTLCGACGDVCPVKVPLPKLLRRLRELKVERGFTPQLERMGMAGFGLAAQTPSLFHFGQRAARTTWSPARLLSPTVRRLPNPASSPLRRRTS